MASSDGSEASKWGRRLGRSQALCIHGGAASSDQDPWRSLRSSSRKLLSPLMSLAPWPAT